MKNILIILSLALIVACSKSDGDVNLASGESGSNVSIGGSTARFTMIDNYLYTVTADQLKVFEQNPNLSIELKNSIYINFGVETIYAYNKLLFLGTMSGVYIYDTEFNPTAPLKLDYVQHKVACDPVVADSKFAYATLSNSRVDCRNSRSELQVIEVSEGRLTSDSQIVRAYDMESPLGLTIADNYVIVCDNGLKVFERKLPDADLTFIGKTNLSDAKDIIYYNNIAMVTATSGLYFYHFQNGQLSFLSKIATNS